MANDRFYDNLRGPASVPAINFFPGQACADYSDCWLSRLAWMRGHYFTWAARTMMHFIAAQPSATRQYLWGRPGIDAKGAAIAKTMPAYWFGPYSDQRFHTVKHAFDQL